MNFFKEKLEILRKVFKVRTVVIAFSVIAVVLGTSISMADWVENATYNDGSYIWDIDYTYDKIGIGSIQPRENLSIYGTDSTSGEGIDTKLGIGARGNRRWIFTARHYDETSGWGCYPLIIDRSIGNYSGNFVIKGDHHAFNVTREGNVGIGTGLPNELLDVRGNIYASGTISSGNTIIAAYYRCSSDARYKKNISLYENALEKVLGLRGVSYFWKADEYKERNFSKDKQIGFIAQEVEKVIPELVFTDDKGYMTMSYDRLTAVIVEAIKELKAKNDQKISALEEESRTRISALESENTALKEKLAKLEKITEYLLAMEKARATREKKLAVK